MTCDICGHRMATDDPGPSPAWRMVWWVCEWCFATAVEWEDEPLGRPRYEPTDSRWALATDPSGRAHAIVTGARCLCGAALDGMEPAGHSWSPAAARACPDCAAFAQVVDARWPLDKRDRRSRLG
ncbi:hypothetical protein [Dactylosporangium sp. CA-139066]|uniref:hypothetical protein n=1 Tax=Dactylosporangium sp. CA-139066 TaxID=3239930 RepID=UPI003D910429